MQEPETLYRKVGRRYVPVGHAFHRDYSMYSDGIWLVAHDGSSRQLIMRLGDTPTVMTSAAFMRHREAMTRAIGDRRGVRAYSTLDLVDAAIRAVIDAEAEEAK